jgi:hypothetical protein
LNSCQVYSIVAYANVVLLLTNASIMNSVK